MGYRLVLSPAGLAGPFWWSVASADKATDGCLSPSCTCAPVYLLPLYHTYTYPALNIFNF